MVRYAREHRCFAILSRDTDFVILRGARYYLSLFYKHFNARDMSTLLFDRNAIAEGVGLHPEHLPLLASLIQNDYVDSSYLAVSQPRPASTSAVCACAARCCTRLTKSVFLCSPCTAKCWAGARRTCCPTSSTLWRS